VLGLILSACAGQAYPVDAPPSPLLGAWEMTAEDLAARRQAHADPIGQDYDCPMALELFEDWTVEANWVNAEHPCDFARMPYREDLSRDPKSLEIGGQLQSCIFRIEGDSVELACDDGTILPRDFLYARTLHRVHAREVTGLAALVGTWTGPAFYGEPAVIRIDADGAVSWDGVRGTVEVQHRTMDVSLPSGKQKCRYRALENRLTLHCRDADEGYPNSMLDRSGAHVMRTTVYQKGTRSPSPTD